MGSVNTAVDPVFALGRIRWHGATPSLMGRIVTAGARLQVFVHQQATTGSVQTADGMWLMAEVVSIANSQLELKTSFARFIAEPSLACRWPLDAAPLTRSELERSFTESVDDVSREMQGLSKRFLGDPELRNSPFERLLQYSAAIGECAHKVQAISALLAAASHDLSARADRAMLVVSMESRPNDG